MAKLAREDEVFIVLEEVERGCSCTVFTMQRCTHVEKIGVCRCASEKEGSCKISFIFKFFLQVSSLTWKFYGFLGSLTCVVKKRDFLVSHHCFFLNLVPSINFVILK